VIFAERLPEVTAYARKTDRPQRVGAHRVCPAGTAGTRFAKGLRLVAGRDTLLRRVRNAPLPGSSEVRVLRVDEWARPKAVAYSTILVDLNAAKPSIFARSSSVEPCGLVAGSSGAEFTGRDRASSYVDRARQGALEAVQS